MTSVSLIGVLLVAFFAGIEGILDEWELQQPLIACTLVGLACGQLMPGIALGATLQLITLGWMNIGAAVAPDAALGAVVSAIMVCGPAHLAVTLGVAIAIPAALVGQWLTMGVRRVVNHLVHQADAAASRGDLKRLSSLHLTSVGLQGLRVALPAALVLVIPAKAIQTSVAALPHFVIGGIRVAVGMLVVVGFAMVINMMANRLLWPFFFIGFALAADRGLSLVALGMIAVSLAIIYVRFFHQSQPPRGGSSDSIDGQTMAELDKELDDL